MPRLEDPVSIGGVEVPNRLYRAPLLECAGNGPEAVDRLIEDLEPAAEAGAGLVCQGATVVRGEGGCAAPNMTRVHDPEFVARLERLTDRVHDHGARIAIQLEHGGLRSMETWHAGYREDHPDLEQLAVSDPPRQLRLLDRAGLLDLDPRVLSTSEVYELAEDFGRAAGRAADAGYDLVHLAGANMGIVQQFLSPFYNRREDEFGGSLRARTRFPRLVYREIREHTDLPVMTKVPVETAAPSFVRRHLTREDAVEVATMLDNTGYDALVPVECSTFWDASIVRGSYPARAWKDEEFAEGYADAFGSPLRARAVALLNRLQAWRVGFDPAWNADVCREVREATDAVVLCEGGIRERSRIDRLLGDTSAMVGEWPPEPDEAVPTDFEGEGPDAGPTCDLVGMARPFYAEPRLPARLLAGDRDAAALCENCNNCTVPQVTGAPGLCRTPSVVRARGEFREAGAYGDATAPDVADEEESTGG